MNSKYTFCLFFVSFLASCGMSEKEKVAVKIVQQTKIDKPKSLLSAIWGVDIEDPNRQQRTETWLDFANDFAKQNPNKRLSWSATTTEQNEIYKASFVDEEGWGTYWEVDIAYSTLLK